MKELVYLRADEKEIKINLSRKRYERSMKEIGLDCLL